jgi:hypothetical protein
VESLDARNVVGSLAFLLNFDLKLHRITLQQHLAKSGILDIALVEEDIFPFLCGNKTKSLGSVEKLDNPLIHTDPFFWSKTKNPSQQ